MTIEDKRSVIKDRYGETVRGQSVDNMPDGQVLRIYSYIVNKPIRKSYPKQIKGQTKLF